MNGNEFVAGFLTGFFGVVIAWMIYLANASREPVREQYCGNKKYSTENASRISGFYDRRVYQGKIVVYIESLWKINAYSDDYFILRVDELSGPSIQPFKRWDAIRWVKDNAEDLDEDFEKILRDWFK